MSAREAILAAVAEAQAMVEAALLGPWRVGIDSEGDSEVVGPLALVTGPVEDADAALIVFAVNLLPGLIDHTRAMIFEADALRKQGQVYSADVIEASLHALWVPS